MLLWCCSKIFSPPPHFSSFCSYVLGYQVLVLQIWCVLMIQCLRNIIFQLQKLLPTLTCAYPTHPIQANWHLFMNQPFLEFHTTMLKRMDLLRLLNPINHHGVKIIPLICQLHVYFLCWNCLAKHQPNLWISFAASQELEAARSLIPIRQVWASCLPLDKMFINCPWQVIQFNLLIVLPNSF